MLQSVNLRSCPRREGPAKRTSGVGPTRVCVTAGETAFGPVAELVDATRQGESCWCESSLDRWMSVKCAERFSNVRR